MPLTVGSRIGPYEVLATLGEGGMGEVYRARDVNLGRAVALKVLPEAFAQDAERLSRFEREAKTLAALSHPNIAIVHGFEKDGAIRALVMELVEGPTLADRIAKGPIPLDEAVPIARQIAEALEAAHEQGIIHRDLKPANIKVRDDGTVKVLDFGLAKMVEGPAEAGHYVRESRSVRPDLSQSPTITTPAMTMAGVILGTAAYMSPEQARGKPVDKRSDIWAFGCVLFEMLTGRRAFHGEDVTDTIAAVVRAEPTWDAVPGDVPTPIRTLVQGCLTKDRKERIGDIAAALFVLRGPLALATADTRSGITNDARRPRPWKEVGWYALAIIASALVTLAGARFIMPADPPAVSQLEISTVGPAVLGDVPTRRVAITPDGSRVVYVGGGGVGARFGLFVRRLNELMPARLIDEGDRPFISPDGQWVGFASQGSLRKVAITGGSSIEIARLEGGLRGATWGPDGKIIFATNRSTGLLRVSNEGGTVEVLTHPDGTNTDSDHVWPQLLPGGHAVLFTISSSEGSSATSANSLVAVIDLNSPPMRPKIVIRGGSDARYVATGHLVYFADGSLRAVRFDPERAEVIGPAVPVVTALATVSGNAGEFDISANGTLVYVSREEGPATARMMTWVDRHGKEEAIPAEPKPYLYPRLSPDGTRVALDVREGTNDIWVWDLSRRTFTRVTKDPGLDRSPVWAADGQSILYSGISDGVASIFRQRADGTGTREQLTKARVPQFPLSLAPGGTQLVLEEGPAGPFNHDLMLLMLDRAGTGTAPPGEAHPLVKTASGEANGTISPDGRWLAYQSDESGSWDIYVRPFADPNGARSIVSTAGGTQPRWSLDGKELFYVSPRNEMMHIRVGSGSTWSGAAPEVLFDGRQLFLGNALLSPYSMYDVAKDGRFLMLKPAPGSRVEDHAANLIVYQGWFEVLKRLVPAR